MNYFNLPGAARVRRTAQSLVLCVVLLLVATPLFAEIPPAEKLLPADTLVMFTVPDCTKMRAAVDSAPMTKLWLDPAMKPFHDKFVSKWQEELVGPLEKDLGVKLTDYLALLQGQFVIALTQDGWDAQGTAEPGVLLLVDTKDKSSQLKTNLTDLRKKWSDAGKSIRTEKIRDVEFSVVTLSSNDVPSTLRQFFPQKQEIQELGREPDKKAPERDQLYLGQFESLLILGNSPKSLESVVAHLTGGSSPALADEAHFEQNRAAFFREATSYGWFNAKRVMEIAAKVPEEKPNPEAPSPLNLPALQKILEGVGLNGLKSIAYTHRAEAQGSYCEIFLSAPEATRKGLFKLLAVEAKDSAPPAFVPADAVKFNRWRLDGQKTIATLEKMLGDISPQLVGTLNFVLQNGDTIMKESDPQYDLRKNIFENLGDDLISYEKAARGMTEAELSNPPALVAISSPNPETLCRSLPGLFVIRSTDALKPKIREFLGRKIYSITLPSADRSAKPAILSYTTGSGYVAFSTDAATIEEFVRSVESPGRPLRESAGFTENAQHVGGLSTGMFAFENQLETMRMAFEIYRKLPAASGERLGDSNPLVNALPFAGPAKSFRDWMDFSLLPEFSKVSQYFGSTVWSGSATSEGLSFKFYAPVPAAK